MSKNKGKKTLASLMAMLLLGATAPVAQAATYTITFNNTTVAANAGPVVPANGAVSIDGTTLLNGDVVVFDGIVIGTSAADSWGAVMLGNTGGYLGYLGADFGVLIETGTASGHPCQYVVNTISTPSFGNSQGTATNHVHIELTCTQDGSTANMNYLIEVDQGNTGTYTGTASGTVSFTSSTIALNFAASNVQAKFIQDQPLIAIAAPTPTINTVSPGAQATFSTALTAGWPILTSEQWLSNGVPILNAHSFTYTTPPTTAGYNGTLYSVIVTNLLTPFNVVTSAVATLNVHATAGIVPFNFSTTTLTTGGGVTTDPGVSIYGTNLLAGDTVVFDALIIPNYQNGPIDVDAWAGVSIAAPGGTYAVTAAKLGVLCRQGGGAGQIFVNGGAGPISTSGGAFTNRLRIELYVSSRGSTTNMGWKVLTDQNLTGTFQTVETGTNLTFPGNVLPLTFSTSGSSSIVYQNPQSPVAFFTQPNPVNQVVAVGAPISVQAQVYGWSPAFQWRKNGVNILHATNELYTQASASISDNGDRFTLVVSNQLNSANVITSAVATVAVLIPNNLTWYPAGDGGAGGWDVSTLNWTTNGGSTQSLFANGNNVTFDSLAINSYGGFVNVLTNVNPNSVTVNVQNGEDYQWTGGQISGQSLLLTGDGSGYLNLTTTSLTSFASATITNATLQIGYGSQDGLFNAGSINLSTNGVLSFNNTATMVTISGAITGSGSVVQNGTATTILSSPNSAYTIGGINAGVLSIASTPNPGPIANYAQLQLNSSAAVLAVPNAISGPGNDYFTGFQTTILTGQSTYTGGNNLAWSHVIVDNPQALGDNTGSGSTVVAGADKVGGLYLSNNITWNQQLEIDPRNNTAGLIPQIDNWNGTNTITSQLTFGNGQGGTELNVESASGLLNVNSTLINSLSNSNNLNLQGVAVGIWNGDVTDSTGNAPLNVRKRGTGVWTLTGNDSYTGNTTVQGGSLLIAGQLSGGGNVTVQSGGTLGGNGGTIAGPVTVAAGGTFAPGGNGSGLLTLDQNLNLSAGSFTAVNVIAGDGLNDRVAGTTIVYGGTLVISNLLGTYTTANTFPIFNGTAYLGAFSNIIPATPGAGLAWNTNTLNADGTLRIQTSVIIPTPTNIVTTVVGHTNLQFTWPANQGWTLEAKTNSLVGTNWVRIPNSSGTNKVVVPIGVGNVFYRLVYP